VCSDVNGAEGGEWVGGWGGGGGAFDAHTQRGVNALWNGMVLEEESASVNTYTATLQIQGLATTGLDGPMVGHSRCLAAAAASLLARRLAEAKGWSTVSRCVRT
jgi:hypothetical protein